MKTGGKHAQNACYLMGANRLGMDPLEYRQKREAGLRWCFYHQRWQEATEFGTHTRMRDGIDTQCVEGRNEYAREYQRRKRAARARSMAS